MVTPEEIQTVTGMILSDRKFRRYECDSNRSFVSSILAKVEKPDPSLFIQTVDSLVARGSLHVNQGKVFLRKVGKEEPLCLNRQWVDAYETLFQRHPELACVANVELLDAALQARATSARLEALLSYDSIHKRLAITADGARQIADETERLKLIDELVSGLSSQIDGRGQKMVYRNRNYGTPYAEEVQRIENSSLEELRAMNQSRLEKQRIAGLDKTALQQELRKSTTRPLPPQFEVMPAIYTHSDGRVEAFSKRMFAKLDLQSQKTIVRKYGANQVNEMIRATQETR